MSAAAGDGPPNTHSLWGGRFAASPADAAARLNWSLPVDIRLWPQDVRAARAWVAALGGATVLTADEVHALEQGLDRVAARLAGGAADAAADEDVHTLVERLLYEEVGAAAGKLNTGRSRNDQVATDLRLWVMEAVDALTADVAALGRALLEQARAGIDLVLPGYTHGQPAQPVRWGYVLLAHAWPLARDRDRLADVRHRAAELPLGSGAVAGTAFAIDRTSLMEQLGFDRLAPNALDATGDRDFVADLLFAGAMVATHLSRLAAELLTYSTSEFGFIRLSDEYCTGSSLLPQKRNPDVLELARGGVAGIAADLSGVLALLKGLPAGYSKDLQDDKRMLFGAVDRLTLLLPALRGAVESMTSDGDRMAAALNPALFATDLADALVAAGVPFREAHGIVGAAVQAAEDAGVAVTALPPQRLATLHAALPDAVAGLGSWEASIERRASVGGSARASVVDQIERLAAAFAARH